ncbi:MAG: hypothetical protein JWN40_1016 [Phycisphaerales bacterium]|nr:hypothetical protein [Phycisphaerales bacterium]
MNPNLYSRCGIVLLIAATSLLALTGCATDQLATRPDESDRAADAYPTKSPRPRTTTTPIAGQDPLVRTALAVPTGNVSTSVLLVEKLGPREARLNRPYDYRIRVTNLTANPLTGVVIRERLPETFTLTRSDPAAKDEGGWINYPIGELPAMGARTVEVTGVPKAEGAINSFISVDYKPALSAVTDVVNPILKLTKEGPADADICEGIRYRYVVSNTGTGTEHDVTIEDALPDGLTTDDGKSLVSLRVGDVPQSTSKELSVRVKPARTGHYASAAVARAPGGVEVRSQEVSTTIHQPKLEMTVDGPATEYLNKTATYIVHVKNTGDAPARRTVLGIDAGSRGEVATVAIAGAPDAADARPLPYKKEGADLQTLAPGESRTATITVRAAREGKLTLTAAVLATCVAPVTATTATSILTLPALRLEVVDLDDPIRVGDNVTYQISVKNQGTGSDKNIAIIATLPTELEFITASGPTEAKADGATLTFTPLETLAAGRQAVWQIQAKAKSPGDVRLQVQLKSDSLTKPAAESEPTRLY